MANIAYIATIKTPVDPKAAGVKVPAFIEPKLEYGVVGETVYAMRDEDDPDLWVVLFNNGDVVGVKGTQIALFLISARDSKNQRVVDNNGRAQVLFADVMKRCHASREAEEPTETPNF